MKAPEGFWYADVAGSFFKNVCERNFRHTGRRSILITKTSFPMSCFVSVTDCLTYQLWSHIFSCSIIASFRVMQLTEVARHLGTAVIREPRGLLRGYGQGGPDLMF